MSEALKWSGKLPVLRIGDIRLCPSSSPALSASRPSVVGCSSRASSPVGAQPGAEAEVPLGAVEMEPLTGFGRDADMKRYTTQHKDTQHIEPQAGYKPTPEYTQLP